jgi:hypothetical protein
MNVCDLTYEGHEAASVERVGSVDEWQGHGVSKTAEGLRCVRQDARQRDKIDEKTKNAARFWARSRCATDVPDVSGPPSKPRSSFGRAATPMHGVDFNLSAQTMHQMSTIAQVTGINKSSRCQELILFCRFHLSHLSHTPSLPACC